MAFAVVDFETTGLMPDHNDRVIEVGLVIVNKEGLIEREWTTLVNPHRDVGATHVHGIHAGDILDAPDFGDIADQFLSSIIGHTIVAHNAGFDMRFLKTELARAGYTISETPPALCTMKWSGKLIGSAKLQHVCEALDVDLKDAHSAIDDAHATAKILTHLARLANHEKEWIADEARSQEYEWPRLQGRPQVSTSHRNKRKQDTRSWLDSVLSNANIPGVPEDEASYLLVLDRALLDRNISISEARQLVATAKDAGLSGANVDRIHRSYLQSIAQEALVDGIITDAERKDLLTVANLLGLTSSDVDEALARAKELCSKKECAHTFLLAAGDRIVFTGETSRPREILVAEIVKAGLESGGVTKSTKLVVAADPDSLSGKAAKARSYGIPIVDEKTFARLFREYCEKS